MIEPTETMEAAFEQAWRAYWVALGHETPEGGPTVAEHGREANRAGLKAVFELVVRDYELRLRPEVVHLATKGDGHFHCCGRTPFEMPRGHRMTLNPHGVTCKGSS